MSIDLANGLIGEHKSKFERFSSPVGCNVTIQDPVINVQLDKNPVSSYLDEDNSEDRLAEYRQGKFYFVGAWASCDIYISNTRGISQSITLFSPGMWGIESDSGLEYLQAIAADELFELANLIGQLAKSLPEAIERTQVTAA